jgi:hypothetical protein
MTFMPFLACSAMPLNNWGKLGLSPVAAYLAAAGLGAVLCTILAIVGMSYLKADNLKPRATIQEVSRDVAMAKELVR